VFGTIAAGRAFAVLAAVVGLAAAAYVWGPAYLQRAPASEPPPATSASLQAVRSAVEGALADHVLFVGRLHASWSRHRQGLADRADYMRKTFLALRDDALVLPVGSPADEHVRDALVPGLSTAARAYGRYREAVRTGAAAQLVAGDALLVRAQGELARVPGIRSDLLGRLTTSTGAEWQRLAPRVAAAVAATNRALKSDRRFRRLSHAASLEASLNAAESARTGFATAAQSFDAVPRPRNPALRRFVASSRRACFSLEAAYDDYLAALHNGRFARFSRAERARNAARFRLAKAKTGVATFGVRLAI
jgi:hypothetical protein